MRALRIPTAIASLRRVLPALLALAALALPASATAGHGRDDDQRNMSHVGISPKSGTVNSDLAFWGNLVYAGNYDGFRIIDVSNPSSPQQLVDFRCRGPQGDVGVWDTGERRLLFQSVDRRQTGNGECSSDDPTRTTGWEGIRIFDVTNARSPRLIKSVATDCGSHTHTVVPDKRGKRVLLYVSSYPLTEQGVHADDEADDGSDTGTRCADHAKESIVSVPFAAPEQARVVNQISTFPAIGCHDVGVQLGTNLAAAACLTEGQVWDISDPVNPKIREHIYNPDIEIWHSGTFTWDGRTAVFGDEEGGAAATHGCANLTNQAPGAIWFYDVSRPAGPVTRLPEGSYTQKRFQGAEVCTAHNYNAVPGIDRDVLASAFYKAGTGVIDFTNRTAASEIGYYDLKGVDGHPENEAWSSYWYDGLVYANDIDRGVDVFRYLGPETRGAARLGRLNPQTQERVFR